MPIPPFAAAQASVNAGAQQLGGQAGGVLVVAADSVQLTPVSTVGWTTSPLWEIYSFPAGWAGPGGTWTLNSATNAWQNTNITPSAIVMPAIAKWGDYLIRLTANAGIGATPAITANLVDASLGLSMVDANGLVDVGYLETNQYDQVKQWIGRLQADLRTIGTKLTAVATAPTGTGWPHITAGAFDAASTDYVFFGANPATSGKVRLMRGDGGVVTRNGANSANLTVISSENIGGDALQIGDASGTTVGCRAYVGFLEVRGYLGTRIDGLNLYAGAADGSVSWAATVPASSTGAMTFLANALVTSQLYGYTTTNAAPGGSSTFAGQDSTQAGAAGGAATLRGGAKNGAGLRGAVRLAMNGTTEIAVEAAEVVSGNRVVALCRMAALTSTQMPANTGDGVVYLANFTTAPTANPVSGGIMYSNAGALTWRGSGGTTTAVAPA